MTNSRPPSPMTASDYEVIYDAMMETSRGRWFLYEYTDRNRSADTLMLLDAIAKLESAISRPQPLQGADTIFEGLLEMSKAIQKTREEVAALKAPDENTSQILNATEELDSIVRATEYATNDILQAAENIQEMAWTLRESGVDNETCDDLDGSATNIYTACSFQDITGQRTQKVVHVLRYLEASLHSMIEIWQPDEPKGSAKTIEAPILEEQQSYTPDIRTEQDKTCQTEPDLPQGQIDAVFSESDLEVFLHETSFPDSDVDFAAATPYAAAASGDVMSVEAAPRSIVTLAEGISDEMRSPVASPVSYATVVDRPDDTGPPSVPASQLPAADEETLSPTEGAANEPGTVKAEKFKRPAALSVQTLDDTQKTVLFNAPSR